jgi:hypothetical protein
MMRLRSLLLAAAGLCLLAPALPAQDEGTAFDADSFFGSSAAASEGGAQGETAGAPDGTAGDTSADETAGDIPEAAQAPGAVYRGSYARPSGLSFTGEASADFVYAIAEPFSASERSASYSGLSALRLDARGGDPNAARLEASAVARLVYGDAADLLRFQAAALLPSSPDADGIASLLLGADGPVLSLELKKLYLSVHMPKADLSVGRMIINYGRGTAFSPVDLFSSLDDSGLKLGRTGSDALRLIVPLSDFSGIDMAAGIADTPELGIAGLRHYGNALGVDYGLSAFRDGSRGADGELVLGLDLKGDLELGIAAEALARLPFNGLSLDAREAVYSLMLGLDYSLGGRWFFDLEGLWNVSAGDAQAAGAFGQSAHGFASLSWKPDELNAFDLRAFYARDGSGQLVFSAARDIAAGASLAAYAQYASSAAGDMLTLGARLSVAY